jgi:hypothetical protein
MAAEGGGIVITRGGFTELIAGDCVSCVKQVWRVNQTWRHKERGGFSGFPPRPTHRQTSLYPARQAASPG